MRIGILGGSFDPPHLGHILVARQVKEIANLDEVWLVPYFAHSWDRTVATASHRLAMTKLVQEEGIKASDVEISSKEKSYTIDTVNRLKKAYPYTFFWIIGGDLLEDFNKWRRYGELIKEITFLVVPRPGYLSRSKLQKGFRAVSSPEFISSNLSSSIIRERIRKNLSIDGIVSKPVLSYIRKYNLYKK